MTDHFNLSGKTVLITGGLGLIGSVVTRKFLEHNCRVYIMDLELEGNLPKDFISDSNLVYFRCDVSDHSMVDKVTEQIYQSTGHIDILFNNAASKSSNPKDFFSTKNRSIESRVFQEVMHVNVQGLYNVTSSVSKYMIKQNMGSIIHTSSIYSAKLGVDHRIYERHNDLYSNQMGSPAVYNASKAAVIGLTKYFASYLGRYNIRVNSISPGGVLNNHSATFVQDYSDRVPMGRMAEVDEIAGPVIFLASALSSYVNGVNLYIDGGLHAW